MNNEVGKIQYISYLRIISMLLIVLFHSLCFYIGTWWYLCTDVVPLWKVIAYPAVNIGLTTFVFISGFLYGYMYFEKGKYRDVTSFLKKKFCRLLIPYFFWGVLMILTMPAVHISWINMFTGIAHLWFLLMLFELFVILAIINRLNILEDNSIYVDIFTIIISFSVLYLWKFLSDHHFILGIKSTLYYLPAFIIGFFYAKHGKIIGNSFYISLFIFTFGIILLFLLSFNGYSVDNTIYRIPSIIVAISTMVLLKSSSISFGKSKVISNLDNNCMGIYLFNQIIVFLMLLYPEVNYYLSCHHYIGPFIIFFVSLFIPWILSNVLRKVKGGSFLLG